MRQLYGKPAEVHGQLSRIGKQRQRLDAEEVRWLVEAVRMKLHLDTGYASMIEYGEKVLGHDVRTAQERVRVAERLVDLPVLFEAMLASEIVWSAARHLSRSLGAVDRGRVGRVRDGEECE